jgi:LPXTG-motif cell wall-anchored protein
VELGTGDAAQTYTNVLVDPTPADTTDNPWKYAYIVDQVQTWTLEGATPNVKLTVETDVEGIITITGLNEGWYVLTETEAPDGYNKLASPIYLHIEPVTTTTGEGENAVTTITGWKVTQYAEDDLEITPATEEVVDEESGEIVTPAAPASYKVKEGKTGTVIDYDLEGNAWLNEIVIVNQSGTELPSTGGIGTTIFYIVGSLLAVGAGVVLVAKKRMGKVED